MNNNPNNLKKGDRIFVEQAWEDESGHFHGEIAIVKKIKESGELILGWSLVKKLSARQFLNGTDEYYARDYN